jgi:hypothetical protein
LRAGAGDLKALAAGRTTSLPGDFVHEPTGLLIEVDESQHFTSFRLQRLEFYPAGIPLGFEISRYKELRREWSSFRRLGAERSQVQVLSPR